MGDYEDDEVDWDRAVIDAEIAEEALLQGWHCNPPPPTTLTNRHHACHFATVGW